LMVLHRPVGDGKRWSIYILFKDSSRVRQCIAKKGIRKRRRMNGRTGREEKKRESTIGQNDKDPQGGQKEGGSTRERASRKRHDLTVWVEKEKWCRKKKDDRGFRWQALTQKGNWETPEANRDPDGTQPMHFTGRKGRAWGSKGRSGE